MRMFLAGLLLCAAPVWGDEPARDVVVYGGTSGGVAAAVQVARMGHSVVLIEPGRHLGGLTSGGLGRTDIGNKQAIGGLSREFYQRVHRYYTDPAVWKQETRQQYVKRASGFVDDDTMWGFEPHVAEAVYRAMLEEAGVPVVLGERLDLKSGVEKRGPRIAAIVMESGRRFPGHTFIDATYEGDLMAKAGVSYSVGREANSEYGEALNGVQTRRAVSHQFVKKVDPYVVPGDPASGLVPRVHAGPPGEEGQGDRRVQAYCFRLTMTDDPAIRRPWPKPQGYDARQYELLLRNFEAGDLREPWLPAPMPNRKTDTNNKHAFSLDNIGQSDDYPDADHATRERIVREHEDYQKGLLWTLANHPRVPPAIRELFQRWGLASDEFTDNDNWPHQLYVREARRMKSDYVMTEHNCRGTELAQDSVGLGAYGMDSHNVQRYATADGAVLNEGDIQVHGFSPYPISYRAIVPKASECTNLLVPVCLSSTHIAFGSIRMEPVFMILGQSAATAAVQAVEAKCDVQDVPYDGLRERLEADGQVLQWTGARRTLPAALDSHRLPGVVVDDVRADFTGDWPEGSAIAPFVDHGYRHDDDAGKGEKTARYQATLPESGRYEVRLAFSPHTNRATNVPVTIVHADGEERVTVNQRQPHAEGRAFLSLGVFRFDASRPAVVTLSTAGTDGHVIADAVQFVPAK